MRILTILVCELLLVTGMLLSPFADAHLRGDAGGLSEHTGVHAHLPIVSETSDLRDPSERQWSVEQEAHSDILDLFLLEVARTSTVGAEGEGSEGPAPALYLLSRLTADASGHAVSARIGILSSRGPPLSA